MITSVVKHKITLKEGAKPIKEHYRRVPLGLYDKVQKHLQEMIDIGAIWPSNSHWDSACHSGEGKELESFIFVLTWGNWTTLMVKDAYSIPRIQDTLDCLQGTVWFMLLD